MAQRLTQQRQIYYGVESTEGTEVLGTANEAVMTTNLAVTPDRSFNPRVMVGTLGSFTGKMGAQMDPGFTMTCELKGNGSALAPEIDELNKSVFGTRTLDTGSTTTSAGCTTTSLVVVSSANFTVGNAVAVETATATVYEVGWISAIPDGTHITLAYALTFTPASGKNVKPSLTYKPANSGHSSLSFQVYLDSANAISFLGCKGSAKVDIATIGAPGTITFNWKAMNWVHAAHARPTPTYDPTVAPLSYLFKLDSSAQDVKLANWDLNQTVARKMSHNSVNGTISQVVANRALKGSLQIHDVDETNYTNWNAGTEQGVQHQLGSSLFNMVAYRIPKAQRQKVSYGDDNGLTTDQIDFQGNITSSTGADEISLAYL